MGSGKGVGGVVSARAPHNERLNFLRPGVAYQISPPLKVGKERERERESKKQQVT